MINNYKNDPVYKNLRNSWLVARSLMPVLSNYQHQLKIALKAEMIKEEKNFDQIRFLRKLMMNNRKNECGLRSLNKKIAAFYKYCESKGIS